MSSGHSYDERGSTITCRRISVAGIAPPKCQYVSIALYSPRRAESITRLDGIVFLGSRYICLLSSPDSPRQAVDGAAKENDKPKAGAFSKAFMAFKRADCQLSDCPPDKKRIQQSQLERNVVELTVASPLVHLRLHTSQDIREAMFRLHIIPSSVTC